MILGVGIDVVRITRIERWLSRKGLLERCFSAEERAYAENRAKPANSLAANYAAKEAFSKALGTGLYGLSMQDICLRRNSGGKPEIVLESRALERFTRLGGNSIYVSLTHEHEYACAVVVLEGGDESSK